MYLDQNSEDGLEHVRGESGPLRPPHDDLTGDLKNKKVQKTHNFRLVLRIYHNTCAHNVKKKLATPICWILTKPVGRVQQTTTKFGKKLTFLFLECPIKRVEQQNNSTLQQVLRRRKRHLL
jgi:hypothetical protein